MANRPVYVADYQGKLFGSVITEFTYIQGQCKSQRQKCSKSLQNSFLKAHPDRRVLEISRYSDDPHGVALSAFNLQVTTSSGKVLTVECAYHGGKLMKEYGALTDLYDCTSIEAKKDPRHREGTLLGFSFDGIKFGLSPRTAYYNWIYIHALVQHPDLADYIMGYDSFTDIVFNPKTASSCQAEACACYVALRRRGLLEAALKNKEAFLEVLYGVKPSCESQSKAVRTSVKAAEDKPSAVNVGCYTIGSVISHPKFGEGEIIDIIRKAAGCTLYIRFSDSIKKIDRKWLIKNSIRSHSVRSLPASGF